MMFDLGLQNLHQGRFAQLTLATSYLLLLSLVAWQEHVMVAGTICL